MNKTDCALITHPHSPVTLWNHTVPTSRQERRPRYALLGAFCIALALIAGCGSPRKSTTTTTSSAHPPFKGGGYYKDDGPGRNIPPEIEKIPDAVPRIERHNPANFRPYTVLGQRFVPVKANKRLRQEGVASWYGRRFHGNKTANGETYDMYAMTAAHPTLPLPSYARVTHAQSGRSVIVRVNDRGPFLRGRVIDLSYAAAAKLGILGQGSDAVTVEAITHADIRKGLNVASSAETPKVVAAAEPRPAAPAPVEAPRSTVPTSASASVASTGSASMTVPPGTASAPASTDAPPTPDALAALTLQTGDAPDEERTPTPTVTESPSEGIYLQFGAFGSSLSADQLANRLNNEIAHVESRNAHISSANDLHRVRIGPYPTRTAAVNAAVRIQEATGMQPTLAQR